MRTFSPRIKDQHTILAGVRRILYFPNHLHSLWLYTSTSASPHSPDGSQTEQNRLISDQDELLRNPLRPFRPSVNKTIVIHIFHSYNSNDWWWSSLILPTDIPSPSFIMTAGRESSPSEETPLIPSSRPDDESIATISVSRGIAIAFFMELLILIQSELNLFGCDTRFMANQMVSISN